MITKYKEKSENNLDNARAEGVAAGLRLIQILSWLICFLIGFSTSPGYILLALIGTYFASMMLISLVFNKPVPNHVPSNGRYHLEVKIPPAVIGLIFIPVMFAFICDPCVFFRAFKDLSTGSEVTQFMVFTYLPIVLLILDTFSAIYETIRLRNCYYFEKAHFSNAMMVNAILKFSLPIVDILWLLSIQNLLGAATVGIFAISTIALTALTLGLNIAVIVVGFVIAYEGTIKADPVTKPSITNSATPQMKIKSEPEEQKQQDLEQKINSRQARNSNSAEQDTSITAALIQNSFLNSSITLRSVDSTADSNSAANSVVKTTLTPNLSQ